METRRVHSPLQNSCWQMSGQLKKCRWEDMHLNRVPSFFLLLVSHIDIKKKKKVWKVFAHPKFYIAEFQNMKEKASILKYLTGKCYSKINECHKVNRDSSRVNRQKNLLLMGRQWGGKDILASNSCFYYMQLKKSWGNINGKWLSLYDSLEKQKPKKSSGDSPSIWSLRSCIRTRNAHHTLSLQSLVVNQPRDFCYKFPKRQNNISFTLMLVTCFEKSQ